MPTMPLFLMCCLLVFAAANDARSAKPDRSERRAERAASKDAATATKTTPKASAKKDPRYGLPDGLASAVALKGGETPGEIREAYARAVGAALPNLGTDDVNALLAFEATVHHAARPGAEPERAACVAALLAALDSGLSTTAKVEVVRQLATVGRAESVPALSAAMGGADPWLAETARRALQNNPDPGAAAALRDALAKAADPAAKTAYALAIAGRGDAAGVPAVAQLLADPDAGVAAAACDALGVLGGDEAARALEAVRGGAARPAAVRTAAALALLRIAEARRRDGRRREAVELLKPLDTPDTPRAVRFAALRGLLAAEGDAAVPRMTAMLAGAEADAKTVALGQIPALGPTGRGALLESLDRLPVPERAAVLGSVARLGDKAALPFVLRFAAATDPLLRAAGIDALAALGDASAVPLLCEALARAQAPEDRAPYEQALAALPGGAATDRALGAALKDAPAAVRSILIKTLGQRGARSEQPALAVETDATDPQTAREAFKALAVLATAEDAGAYVARLAALRRPETRGEAENAARRALARVADAAGRSELVCGALAQSTDRDARISLLRLLPDAGDRRAFETLSAALGDADARIRDGAVRALTQWPDFRAWDTMGAVYAKPEKEAHRAAALNGMARLVRAASAKPAPELIGRCRQMLAGAATDDDRKLVLGVLGGIGDPAAAELAKPLLADPAVQAEAKLAVKSIAALLRKTRPADAAAVLKLLK